jgi:hypothetical protein
MRGEFSSGDLRNLSQGYDGASNIAGMKIVKTTLNDRMGDPHLSNRLICYVEKEEF